MTFALRSRSLAAAAAALAAAALPAYAAASGAGIGNPGKFTGDTDTTQLANIDAATNAVIAVVAVPGEGYDKATPNSGRLWFSRLDDSPSLVVVDPVPAWAQPHWGTDAAGRRVAVYPRCAGGTLKDCDLYAWDAESNKERKLTEVDRDGVGEVEGAMERGAIAFTRQTAATASASAAKDPLVSRTLWLQRVGQKAVQLAATGGTDLALHSGVVAQEVLKDPNAFDDSHSVQLVRAGKPTRVVDMFSGGMDARHTTGMRFFGKELRFAKASFEGDALYRVPISGKAKARGKTTSFHFGALAWSDTDTVAYVPDTAADNRIPLFVRDAPAGFR